MKKVVSIFIISFILNLIWENLHSFLYLGYKGDKITEFILLRATLGDAIMITLISLPFIFLNSFKKYTWIIIPIGIIIAVSIEWYALGTGRWAYNEYMPIVPYLEVGLTPLIQLGVLGYISVCLEGYINKNISK